MEAADPGVSQRRRLESRSAVAASFNACNTNCLIFLEQRLAKVVVVTSGKGGVGKTTSSAAIGTGLAQIGNKTVIIDFDVGLRNLDLIMGC